MQCGSCGKQGGSDLKNCSKCKSVYYCNKECQKADWKQHKKSCALLANTRFPSSEASSGGSSARSDAKPFTAIYYNKFLHDRSETQTYQILIDVIRMRQEDIKNIEGSILSGSIYDGNQTSEKALREYLRKAKQIEGFLPPWWTDEKVDECVQYGLSGMHGFSLSAPQTKANIQSTWSDDKMPMKVRMLGEKIYGTAPGGTRGDSMLTLMMNMEGGAMAGMATKHLDAKGFGLF